MNILLLQPFPYPSISVSLVGLILTHLNLPRQISIMLRLAKSLYEVVVATPGYIKELAHD